MPYQTIRIAREEAKRQLTGQIDKGKQLVMRPIATESDLKEYLLDRVRYAQYNEEMLRAIFGNDDHAFWRYKLCSPRDSADFDEQIEFYREWDTKQVNELQGIYESLDLFSEANSTVSAGSRHEDSSEMETPKRLISKQQGIAGVIITAVATLIVGYWQFVYRPAHSEKSERVDYTGRITDTLAHRPIYDAKVSIEEDQGVPQVQTTDSDGVFHVRLRTSTKSVRIRVEMRDYEVFERNVNVARTGLEPINLTPINQSSGNRSSEEANNKNSNSELRRRKQEALHDLDYKSNNNR